MTEAFARLANRVSGWVGAPWFFVLNLAIVLVWLGWGLVGGFSDTMQLVMTTGLTVTTQLLVILIQATQNRDGRAIHLKLDELLRAVAEARTVVATAEDMPADELEARIEAIKEEREEEQGGSP